ncbi:MAG: UDP-N-acetylmuramoyl-tripeptide--D-alanyl-D-alanine ligase [Limnobacter sp.]|nr:UDP-N-acetylmuramoyl-tripeptide--D-alanyl-D-alanine ligase [Limnobacter sp.]
MFELRQALAWLSAGRLLGEPSTVVTGVSTDTRAIEPGQLFVALRGERFDAHGFLAEARARGAAAVLFDQWRAGIPLPALWAPDARRALGELAAGWRRRFSLPLVAVTGSNGKTTVKEMIAAIFAEAFEGSAWLATRGNLNNEVGVPLTLFRLGTAHRAAVVELGMNHPGEIAWLARIAAPTIALVNNAQREHQEFLHSVEATARENGAAIAALPGDGVAVFPGDDPHASIWRELAGERRRLEFGLVDGRADAPGGPPGSGAGAGAAAGRSRFAVSAAAGSDPADFAMTIDGRPVRVHLAIDGAHNVRNALAAAACARAAGIDAATIARGLARFRPAAGRLVRLRAASGATLIDDSYNANPDSVRAAIDVLAALPAPRLLVLGDMGEVGDQGPRFHREVGEHARERGVSVLALGPATRETVAAGGPGAEHFDDVESLLERLRELAVPPATVLVKGSRSMRMERVVAALAGNAVAEAH